MPGPLARRHRPSGGARVASAARNDGGEQAAHTLPPPSLGIYANFAAALPPETAFRLEKWELQSYSRLLLPTQRIRHCCLSRIPGRVGVDVYHSPAHNSAHYGGLQTCGSVWSCPVCSSRISERRRELLTRAVEASRQLGAHPLLVTYTFSHQRSDRLSATLESFLAAQRSMAGNRPYRRAMASYGVVGVVKALEVTWKQRNGWHPHAHVLMFAPSEISAGELEEDLYRAWLPAAHREGLTMTRARGVKVQSTFGKVEEYISKWGHPPTRRLWGAEDELTKGHSKRAHRDAVDAPGYSPFDLLRWLADTGESAPARLFREYAGVFKGRQQLTWSPGLAKWLGVADDAEKSDEEIAGEVREDAILLATLSPLEWRAVRSANQRGQLLELARTGDVLGVRAFVRQLVADGLAGRGDTAGDQAAGGAA